MDMGRPFRVRPATRCAHGVREAAFVRRTNGPRSPPCESRSLPGFNSKAPISDEVGAFFFGWKKQAGERPTSGRAGPLPGFNAKTAQSPLGAGLFFYGVLAVISSEFEVIGLGHLFQWCQHGFEQCFAAPGIAAYPGDEFGFHHRRLSGDDEHAPPHVELLSQRIREER